MTVFKDKQMQKLYEICRRHGSVTTGEFYYHGVPRRGAPHRTAYWVGRSGEAQPNYIRRTSLAYACYRAGCDDRKEDAKKDNAMPDWTWPQWAPADWTPR